MKCPDRRRKCPDLIELLTGMLVDPDTPSPWLLVSEWLKIGMMSLPPAMMSLVGRNEPWVKHTYTGG